MRPELRTIFVFTASYLFTAAGLVAGAYVLLTRRFDLPPAPIALVLSAVFLFVAGFGLWNVRFGYRASRKPPDSACRQIPARDARRPE